MTDDASRIVTVSLVSRETRYQHNARRSDGMHIKSYCGQSACQGRRHCRACTNIYSRASRRPYAELPDEARKKSNCRAYTKTLQQRGNLPKGPCEGCGSSTAQNHHHWGYDQPRWFIRLCRDCHLALERMLKV